MKHQLLHKFGPVILLISLIASQIRLTGLVVLPAYAASGKISTQPIPLPNGKIDTGDLETFVDATIEKQLDDYHIAGATVSIVQDGKIAFAKGYGYADIEAQIAVEPDETIFRIGSISKLFTWTAVMQLAEQGKIDLDADINTYLTDFQIPATYPKPITMRNLLSHTAGFEERATGIESPSPDGMISLHDCLKSSMPDRVRPAGELITYSNYGAALAGYIVELISGLPFEQYVETYIFEPLSMSHSTFLQPLPADLEDQLAISYSYDSGYVPGKFDYVNLRPAGAMSSTAQDMANFIIAHLQDGKFEDNQILKPETTHQMHSQLFTNDERLDGMAYGFIEWNYNGQRVLWHGGDIGNWHAGLAMIPEQNLGFFVNYNSIESYPAVNEFYAFFMDTFFPAQAASEPLPAASTAQDGRDLAGEYRSTRSIYNHVERALQFPGYSNLKVAANPDGTLTIAGAPYYEIEPLVYSPVGWNDTVIFHQGSRYSPTYLMYNSNQLASFERVSWYETSTFNLLAFGVCYVLLLTVLIAAVVNFFKHRRSDSTTPRLALIARIWALAISVLFLLVPVIVGLYGITAYKFTFPFYMVITLTIILAASVLVVGPVIFTLIAWVRRYWGVAGRLHYTFITLALLGMVWMMYYWRLLGFRY
jgi:CubicO group peptidase (beta-lactamase class C family)